MDSEEGLYDDQLFHDILADILRPNAFHSV